MTNQTPPRSSTATLVTALRVLAAEIQSPDGAANAAIAEAADRLEELATEKQFAPQKVVRIFEKLSEHAGDLHDEATSIEPKFDFEGAFTTLFHSIDNALEMVKQGRTSI